MVKYWPPKDEKREPNDVDLKTILRECCLYLDNRVFLLISKQANAILTNQNRDEKANLQNNY